MVWLRQTPDFALGSGYARLAMYGKTLTNLTCDVIKPCVHIKKRAQKQKNVQICLVQPIYIILPLLCFKTKHLLLMQVG